MDNSQNQPKPNRTFRLILCTLILLGLLGVAFVGWLFFLKPNVPPVLADEYVVIPTGSNLDDVIRILKEGNFISDDNSFRFMAQRLKYRGRAGRFRVTPGMSSFRLVRHLRGGAQSPVKVVLVNERLPEDIAGKVAQYIEADSASLVAAFYDPAFLDSTGLDSNTLLS
ncbi:MAG: endolytic transglycosylase MltG, partial [Bacteroidota bacterium]